MNEDTVKGNWKQVCGKIRQKRDNLTDDDPMRAEGTRTTCSASCRSTMAWPRTRLSIF